MKRPKTPSAPPDFAVHHKKLSDLTPDARNANRGTERGAKAIQRSLKDYGAGRSILLDKHGAIIAGNKTAENAGAAGLGDDVLVVQTDGTKIIAVQRMDLDLSKDARAKGLAIADNRAGQLSLDWDPAVLASFTSEIELSAYWTKAELGALLPAGGLQGDLDEAPSRPDEPTTRLGDLYVLGNHRLLCGDSTSAADVNKLMLSHRADLVFTDPPYGVDYDGGTLKREKLAGDASTELYGPCCAMAREFSTSKAALYLWHAGVKGIAAAAAAAAAAAGWEIRCELIWNKNLAQFGSLSSQYKQKHEPCYYCFKKGNAPHWFGPTNETTVWDVDRSQKNEFHPTQKPIALAERAIANSCPAEGNVLDLFGGSGTTLIAAEKTGRKCFMMELSPAYCDVIVTRWENATGKKAVKHGA